MMLLDRIVAGAMPITVIDQCTLKKECDWALTFDTQTKLPIYFFQAKYVIK